MIDPVKERRPPISPQLAVRVAVLGGIAFVLFAVIFFRLWYLQVLSGDQYLAQARDNRVRVVRIQAPRGQILDRSGNPIVENRAAVVVSIDPESLPAAERTAAADWFEEYRDRQARPKGKMGAPIAIPAIPPELRDRFERLGRALNMRPATIQERVIRALGFVPYAAAAIKVDISEATRNRLLERRAEHPGVDVSVRYVRDYPSGTMGAQLFGNVGQISPDQLDTKEFRGVSAGTEIGQGGLERYYDQYLRGTDGSMRITIDAFGRPKGEPRRGLKPQAGDSLVTSLDTRLQEVGERALRQVIAQGDGTAGGFVAMDLRDGKILGLGSFPTFDPAVFSKPISDRQAEALFGPSSGAPLTNRAISGLYPTGSIFKPITALTGLKTGLITPQETIVDTGCTTVGANDEERCNAKKEPLGTVNLLSAISRSSDVYFYELGEELNGEPNQPLQQMARDLSLGHTTGIDLSGEAAGLIPDREWRRKIGERERECREREGVSLTASGDVAFAAGCGYSDMREWTVGDEVNLAIGQGDLQATPLQMAVAYAAIANGGRVVQPHLGVEVQDADGRTLQRVDPGQGRRVALDQGALAAVRAGLREATLTGTSADVFNAQAGGKTWPHDQYPVFGKTGTAQRNNRPNDQSWYACYVNDSKRPIVVVVTVEDGGWGAEAAAPIARSILAAWYDQPTELVAAGTSETN